MKHRLLFLLAWFSLSASPQSWSTFLDASRAIDWTGVGFTIPNYTTPCPTQPSLTPNDPSAAPANKTAIENALASCDATRNVVNIPAGTYYVAGFTYKPQGKQVLRGAGPMSTTLIPTSRAGCGGMYAGVCMISSPAIYGGNAAVLPPSGTQQCLWTGGYAKGTTTITLSSCGGTPPTNRTIILDQANDTADTGGVYICDSTTTNCTLESSRGGGRLIGGVSHSQSQVVYVTGITNIGDGKYSVTITPGVHFNNIRSAKSPGAWWPGFVQNDGLENMTIDGAQLGDSSYFGTVSMYNCYQCWMQNVRSLYGGRNHIRIYQSAQSVVRNNYFFQSMSHYSTSYGIEPQESSGILVENNILQQLASPIMFGMATGSVIGYNLSINNIYQAGPGVTTWAGSSSAGHTPGSGMNLWEGNNLYGIWTDNFHGTTAAQTFFRNKLSGWKSGILYGLFVIALRSQHRAFNAVGNILGQPSVQSTYEAYATSSTTVANAAGANTSIYELGSVDYSANFGGCNGSAVGSPGCDPLVRSTLMRWGNYDTVTAGTRWDSGEASPGAVAYVNANFTSSYFSSLPRSLPASLYYSSRPGWWPATKVWPAVGPDVTSGNLGICSGTYGGAQATASGQCTGGSLTSAWAGHANSIPAQDCYLNVMRGPPDGTGNVLSFDAALCYASSGTGTGPASPTGLAATVR